MDLNSEHTCWQFFLSGKCVCSHSKGLSIVAISSRELSVMIARSCYACRYISRPLLIDRRKFHIRAYVLCVGSLSVYVYSEALALFAGKEYDRWASQHVLQPWTHPFGKWHDKVSSTLPALVPSLGTFGSHHPFGLLCTSRDDLGNLDSHLTNTCHLQRSSSPENGTVPEEHAVKLLSELPQVTRLS